MYCRARLRRNSSTTSSKVVPSLANLRASVRVLMASFFATLCLCALPCGSNFCASFSTKARKAPWRRFALLGRLVANGSKGVQQVHVFCNERRSETLIGEDELIGRPAKFDRTAAEPLKLSEARVAHVDEGYFCRVNIPACDLSQTLHDNRDSKLGVLRRPKPRNADEVKLDGEVTVLSRQFYANGFVYDPADNAQRALSPRQDP